MVTKIEELRVAVKNLMKVGLFLLLLLNGKSGSGPFDEKLSLPTQISD